MTISRMVVAVVVLGGLAARAQDTATLNVTVSDSSSAVVPNAKVTLSDLQRGSVHQAETNGGGFALFDFLQPGDYTLEVVKPGFDTYRALRLPVRARDRQTLLVELKVSAATGASVEVTDRADALSTDTTQGASVDQDYIQNLPTNGRSVESLILMAPGITSAGGGRGGDGFNTNGLRSNTNYYTLDGVSVNRGSSGGGPMGGGPGMGGGPPVGGGGGGGMSGPMISLDALQEMKVQTSSFAPEFGRTPGAQVVMTSRGGGNDFHGTLSYYKRSDVFDANDWFANAGGYGKGRERQDRPGVVFGGPLIGNKTFFFASWEKLKLQSPQSIVADVPNLASRASASDALRPYLEAYPLPNGADLGSGAAEYRAVVSNPSHSDSYSLRFDHALNATTNLFARASLSTSGSERRGTEATSPNVVSSQSSRSEVLTAGATHVLGDGAVNDLRLNYSRSSHGGWSWMDNYGGAVPLNDSLVFPDGINSANGSFGLSIMGFAGYSFGGRSAGNQQQINIVDGLTKIHGAHHLKVGMDYRKLLQTTYNNPYSESVSFNGMTDDDYSFLTGTALNGQISASVAAVYPTYQNVSFYGQDTWRMSERTTLTYGLRWDINPAPTTSKGEKPFALSDSTVAGVTQNEPLYPTRWFDLAPRVGISYLSDTTPGHEIVMRFGAGVFYDLGYGVVDSAFFGAPYSAVQTASEVTFPFSSIDVFIPTLPPTRPYGQVTTGSADLKSPVILQWNGTWEKYFGSGQLLSIGVSGTRGYRLMRTESQPSYSGAYDILQEVTNGASSTYNGLQIQFRKRIAGSFQTQLSYTWSHALDSSSSDMGFGGGFASLFGGGQRGSSDYDIRHTMSFSGSWLLPSPGKSAAFYPFRHWYLDFIASAHTGLPFDIQGVSTETSDTSSSDTSRGLFARVRPDYNGQPVWIKDANVPGGKRLNKDAFTVPDGYEQGNLGRNALRGFGFYQLDLSLRRSIPIGERRQINLAAQGYNILNHPNFANLSQMEGGNMSSPSFGVASRMANQGFGGGSLYGSGGARSMELSVRVQF